MAVVATISALVLGLLISNANTYVVTSPPSALNALT
jgi:hypothetical protein